MKRTGIILLALLLAACESGLDRRYLDASSEASLVLPPDLIEFDGASQFALPEIFSADDPSQRNKIPVLAKVESMKLEGGGNFYWLSVDEPADNLYPLIKNFWASEGYKLEMDEPSIGIMQTEWGFREVGSKQKGDSWFSRLFGEEDLSARQDQFKTRVERDPASGVSRIYISHRATEYRHQILAGEGARQKGDVNQWRFRQPESELEVEMLSRLMIYLGLQQVELDNQLQQVKLFAPRATQHFDSKESSPYLLLKTPYRLAWNRVYHELERLNTEILNFNPAGGLLNEGDITINARVIEKNNQGGLAALFASSTTKTQEMVLVISEENHKLSRVTVETPDGDLDTSAAAANFLDLLYQRLR